MAASSNVGKHFEDMIQELLASGRYSTASEIVRDGLRLVEQREKRLEALRAKTQKGLDSGPAEEIGDMSDEIKAGGQGPFRVS